jgi:WD40 repeat protein
VLVGHVGQVNTARFDETGDRIVSAGLDGTVRLWDSAGGETLLVLHADLVPGPHGALADFSRDGRSVVSANSDGTLITPCEDRVCGSLSDVRRAAESRAARPLSTIERQRLLG